MTATPLALVLCKDCTRNNLPVIIFNFLCRHTRSVIMSIANRCAFPYLRRGPSSWEGERPVPP